MVGIGGIDVFPLALGGNTFGWTSDEATSYRVLDAYVEGGGDFLDTADSYSAWVPGNQGGESETIIGGWLRARGNRDRVVIGTKVSQHPEFKGLKADTVARAVDASLTRLGTDHIDLYWAHFDDASTPLEETAAAFDAVVKAGKARTIGLSNYSGERIREWFAIARRENLTLPVALQPHYNLVRRTAFEQDLAPVVDAENLAVVPYYALAGGFLTGKYKSSGDLSQSPRGQGANQYLNDAGLAVIKALEEIAAAHGAAVPAVALSWLRGRPHVAAPIASARTIEQLPALLASATLELTAGERAILDEVSSGVPA